MRNTLRSIVATAAAVALFGAVSSSAAAQTPSPEPPPWAGGRVELPEHGFALTLPDDWVGFDPTAGFVDQAEAVSDLFDPSAWFLDEMPLWETVASLARPTSQLLALDTASFALCNWAAEPVMAMPADEAAEGLFQVNVDNPTTDAEPPQRIELPVGPAYRLRTSEQLDPIVVSSSSTYIVGRDEGGLLAMCTTLDARPEDGWLSIVETVEFLTPAE